MRGLNNNSSSLIIKHYLHLICLVYINVGLYHKDYLLETILFESGKISMYDKIIFIEYNWVFYGKKVFSF